MIRHLLLLAILVATSACNTIRPLDKEEVVPAIAQARVDLEAQILSVGEQQIPFEVDSFRRHCLLNGLDDIGLTLQMSDDIRAYEERRRQQAPWLFDDLNQLAAGN